MSLFFCSYKSKIREEVRLRAHLGRRVSSKSPWGFRDRDEGVAGTILGGMKENSVCPKRAHWFTLLANQWYLIYPPNIWLLAPSLKHSIGTSNIKNASNLLCCMRGKRGRGKIWLLLKLFRGWQKCEFNLIVKSWSDLSLGALLLLWLLGKLNSLRSHFFLASPIILSRWGAFRFQTWEFLVPN